MRATPVRLGGVSGRLPHRAAATVAGGLGALGLLLALDLALGDLPIPVPDVLATLLGGGDPGQRFVVLDLRLPQALVAALTGAALALSGALTQSFARNPIASPDILGVNDGAALAAVATIVLVGGEGAGPGPLGSVGLSAAAFVGGLATAALLYALAWRRGIDGQRFVLVGIGVGATLTAATSWLLVRGRVEDADTAQRWLNGSLTNRGWDEAAPLLAALALLVPLSLAVGHALDALLLGDDSARGLGVRLQTVQLLTLLAAVGLAAVAVAAVGPLAFVALVTPQVALRLTGGGRPPMVASMVLGACFVVAADLLTRVVLPFALPAGLVTAAVGAPYLIWLLLRANRKVTA